MNTMTEFAEDENTPERTAATRRSTWVSVGINLLLTMTQVSAGLLAGSQGLIADGIHQGNRIKSYDFLVR